jgi:hypothetical protein
MRLDTKPQRTRRNAVPVRLGNHGNDPVSVRQEAVPFEPTRQDLKLVQGYLAREIVRLQERHAEITRLLSGC